MSPIVDSRWTEARRKSAAKREAAEDAEARKEWLIPLALLIAGVGVVITAAMVRESGGEADAPPPWLFALIYPVRLAIEVVIGMLGLWAACALWLGGAGPLGLGLLRLAGIYAIYDAIVIAIPLGMISGIIGLLVYIGLLVKLFDLEAADAIMLVIITFVLKLGVGLGLMALLAGL